MPRYPKLLTEYEHIAIDAGANATRTLIVSGGANTQLWIYFIVGTTNADGTIQFLDSAPTDHTGDMPIMASSGFVLGVPPKHDGLYEPVIKCATDTIFLCTLSVNSDFDGKCIYQVVPGTP